MTGQQVPYPHIIYVKTDYPFKGLAQADTKGKADISHADDRYFPAARNKLL